ncbi:Tec1p [Sporobolomyces koalae]|uniref:Tec1p n=1 Tax=Sporobolomyces koalae TaxID=500713 RepID=UPI00316EB7A1
MQQPYPSPPPPLSGSYPASATMMRKRTFQDMQPGVSSSPVYSACGSSPSSAPFPDYNLLSSPETSISTIASSPMSRNASTQSCFSTFSPSTFEQSLDNSPQNSFYTPFPSFSPSQGFVSPQHVSAVDRPGMKRRKTMPDVHHLSPTGSTQGSREFASPFTPRTGGKDGEDVWPPAVEECFQTALRLLPRLGRKKLIIQGKPCGRNELIADYIFRHTGKTRSRKQVSSHIQVLKNLRKEDEEFMFLVSDPVEGEDRFLPGNAELFFGKNGLASPHAPPVFLERSLSASNIPHHPPIDLSTNVTLHALAPPHLHRSDSSSDDTLHSPFKLQPSPTGFATTPTSGITRALQGMTVAMSPTPSPAPIACPIAPSSMSMIARTSSGEQGHVYAQLDASEGPRRTVYLEDLPLWEKRYGSIPAMNDHLPCQFLHVHLPLSIPGINGTALTQPLETRLELTSIQALPLTAITSIYCHGDPVITYEDTLEPVPLDTISNSTSTLDHQYCYDVSFGSDFWTMLLRGNQDGFNEPTLRKSSKERQAIADMLPGFSVVQEFVVPADTQLGDDSISLSPGSAIGDVVLVVLYDLEVNKGARTQAGKLSLLSVRRSSATLPSNALSHPSSDATYTDDHYSHELPSLAVPYRWQYLAEEVDQNEHATALDTAPSHHHTASANKPNLSLHIPPPPRFGTSSSLSALSGSPSVFSNGPITPWGQVVHTPTHPPPVLPPLSAVADAQRDRSRLEAAWRSNANANSDNRWDLESPALFPPAPNYFGLYGSRTDSDSYTSGEPRANPTISSNLHSFAMDRRLLSTPVISTSAPSSRPRRSENLLPPLPSPSSLAANFATGSTSYSPSPLSSFAGDSSCRPVATTSTMMDQVDVKPDVKPDMSSPEKKPLASKMEQDAFFSSLLGSTTRYTVTS